MSYLGRLRRLSQGGRGVVAPRVPAAAPTLPVVDETRAAADAEGESGVGASSPRARAGGADVVTGAARESTRAPTREVTSGEGAALRGAPGPDGAPMPRRETDERASRTPDDSTRDARAGAAEVAAEDPRRPAIAAMMRGLHAAFPPSATNTRDEAPVDPPRLDGVAPERGRPPAEVAPPRSPMVDEAPSVSAPTQPPRGPGLHARSLAEALAAAERWVSAPPEPEATRPSRARSNMSQETSAEASEAESVEISIGAIQVTIEGSPAPAPASTPRPAPAPASAALGARLGRHYLRGL